MDHEKEERGAEIDLEGGNVWLKCMNVWEFMGV